jgi:hypothetical protein
MSFSKQDTCKYIRETSAQLAALSAGAGLEVLSYTLSMAQLEADNQLTEMLKPPIPRAAAYGPIRDRTEPAESLVAFAP